MNCSWWGFWSVHKKTATAGVLIASALLVYSDFVPEILFLPAYMTSSKTSLLRTSMYFAGLEIAIKEPHIFVVANVVGLCGKSSFNLMHVFRISTKPTIKKIESFLPIIQIFAYYCVSHSAFVADYLKPHTSKAELASGCIDADHFASISFFYQPLLKLYNKSSRTSLPDIA